MKILKTFTIFPLLLGQSFPSIANEYKLDALNLDKVKKWDWNDKVYSCLNEAIITNKDSITNKTLKKLKPVLKRRFSL